MAEKKKICQDRKHCKIRLEMRTKMKKLIEIPIFMWKKKQEKKNKPTTSLCDSTSYAHVIRQQSAQ